MGRIRNTKLFLIISVSSFLYSSNTFATEEHRKSRAPASVTSTTSKYVSLAYNHFYHRNDTAGCFNIGLAYESLKHPEFIDAKQIESLNAHLKVARNYCQEDKVTRHDVVENLRNSVRVLSGKSPRGLSSE